jgi:hypothetical protein
MRAERLSSIQSNRLVQLLQRVVTRRRESLLSGRSTPGPCGRAVRLNPMDDNPLWAALRRNIEAACQGRPAPCAVG